MDRTKICVSGVLLSALVAIIRCWGWRRTEQSYLCYFPLILSPLPTIFSSEISWPIYSVHAVSNSQWFLSFMNLKCVNVSHPQCHLAVSSAGLPPTSWSHSTLWNILALLWSFSCPTKAFSNERSKTWVHSRWTLIFFVLSSILSLVTINISLIIVEHWRFHRAVMFSAPRSFIVTVGSDPTSCHYIWGG